MMENRPSLPSPDGSSNGNPPERCPRPLYSWDSTQDRQEIIRSYQSEGLIVKAEVKEEETDLRRNDQCKKKKIPPEISPAGSNSRNTPERCPSPILSRDSTLEDQTTSDEHQDDNLITIKVEVKDEEGEETARGDEPCKEEEIPPEISQAGSNNRNTPERCPSPISSQDSMLEDQTTSDEYQDENLITVKVEVKDEEGEETAKGDKPCKEEEIPPEIIPGQHTKSNLAECSIVSSDGDMKDDDITAVALGEITPNVQPGNRKGVKSISCTVCGKRFVRRVPLLKHMRSHKLERPYSCLECGKCFVQKVHLVVHQRIHTGLKPYSCQECGKCFTQKASLVHHQSSHRGVKAFSCSDCGKSFRQKFSLIKHQRMYMQEKPYSCSDCGKCFASKSTLLGHQKTHTGEKPFACPQCGKCFATKSTMVIHQKTHMEQKPYKCSECGKCFAQKTNLLIHQTIHTGEKPFSCTECGRRFAQKSRLISHQRRHTGEKPYSCPECGETFATKSSLSAHQRIHTNNLFSCPDCGKGFIYKSNMVKHRKTHAKEKPHVCSECGKSFTQKSGLVRHQRVHTGKKLFSCSDCDKSFNWKSSLVGHQKSHRTETP